MSLPTDPFAFKSAAFESGLATSKLTISNTGATSVTPKSALPSAAAMFANFASTNTGFDATPKPQPVQDTSFHVPTDSIAKSAQAFRSTHEDDDEIQSKSSFDAFKLAQEHIDQNTFESFFESLDMNSKIEEKQTHLEELRLKKLQTEMDSGNSIKSSTEVDWLDALAAIEAEVEKVEQDIKRAEEEEIQNAIAMIGDAISNRTTISLPSQSLQSRELTEYVTKLYSDFNQKQKVKKQTTPNKGAKSLSNDGFLSKSGSKKQQLQNQKAANKAISRFDRLDAPIQQRQEQKRRNGNGQIDFLNDEIGPYKKQSQQNKKKGKKADW